MKYTGIDRIGAIASAMCAVHCMLTGVALGLLSYAGLGFMGSFLADATFLAIAVAIAMIAIVHGIRRHHSYRPALIFVFGLVCILMGHFVLHHEHNAMRSEVHLLDVLSTTFSVGGGFSLVLFHVLNLRLQSQCSSGDSSSGR